MITIQLSKDDAAQLENFLRGFMLTYAFKPPHGGLQMKAFGHLHTGVLTMPGRVEPYKLQLDPWQDATGLHVIVSVENYDGSWSTAPISPVLFERVAYQLEHLLGKSFENVKEIEAELNAGRWVLVDGRCARKKLVNAGFVEQ